MSEILSPDKNPAYGEWTSLPDSIWNTLENLKDTPWPVEIIRQSQGGYHLPFLGHILLIYSTKRHMEWKDLSRTPTFQEGLVALTFLANFKMISLSKKWITPAELPGGRTFFSPRSHPPKTSSILKAWENRPAFFHRVMTQLGATSLPHGDEAFEIPCLPLLPFRYVFWEGEPSLPSSVTLLVNATAHLFLPLDVLWALINLVDERFTDHHPLCEGCREMV